MLQKESERSTTLTNGFSTPTTPVKENATTAPSQQVVLNGFHGSLPSAAATTTAATTLTSSPLKTPDALTPDASCGESDETCSRTCPLIKTKFRKRNLIRLDSCSTQMASGGISNSRSKYSSVRCDCVPPLSCVLCAFRGPGVDLSYQHIYSNFLPVSSKIALLEPNFHSVLSFPSGK